MRENIEGKNFLSLFPIWKISKGKISFPSFLYGKYRREKFPFPLSYMENIEDFPFPQRGKKSIIFLPGKKTEKIDNHRVFPEGRKSIYTTYI